MKSTEAEESDDSSEKWLRGANVFSVSAGHISLRARKCSDILLALGVLSPLSLSSLPARGLGPGPGAGPGPADTVEGTLTWSHSSQHNIIQPTTLLCITKYETERGRKFTVT